MQAYLQLSYCDLLQRVRTILARLKSTDIQSSRPFCSCCQLLWHLDSSCCRFSCSAAAMELLME